MGLRKAVALRYLEDCPAPFLVAKGRGEAAVRLEGIARSHGVPVREDPGLAEGLYPLAPGQWIPEEYYQAVAAILAAIWRMEGGRK